MIVVLLCSAGPLDTELRDTVFYRRNMERIWARNLTQARAQASEAKPDIIVVDHALPEAPRLVSELREDPHTRQVSIALLARGDFALAETALLQVGANAILRLPPDPDWDDRLSRLIHVPARRDARLPINLQVQTEFGQGTIVPAVLLNLSIHGMLLACTRKMDVGQELSFSFHLPHSPGLIQGSGSVVRVVGNDEYGVELTNVKGDGRQRIRNYVEAVAFGQ